jgi:PAS domain S-box-containing protein
MNDWLTSATVAAFLSSLMLVLIYAYVYRRHRESFFLWWTWAWVLHAGRFFFTLASITWGRSPALASIELLCILASSMALLRGSLLMGGKPEYRGWLIAGLGVGTWAFAAGPSGMADWMVTLPVYFFAGVIQIRAGIIFLRLSKPLGFGEHLAGWSLIAWGLHKLDYSFLHAVSGFTPWGFALGAVLGILVAVGQLLWYFERVQSRLLVSEGRYRELFETSPLGVFLFSQAQGIITANKKSLELLGFTFEELKGLGSVDIVHPDDLARLSTASVTGDLAPGHSVRLERRYRRKDGQYLQVEADMVRLREEDRFLVIFQDVTEQRRVSQALLESETRFRQMAEHIDQIFFLATPDYSEFLYVNPAYERIFGKSVQSLYDHPESWKDSVHPDDRERLAHKLAGFVGTGRYEARYRIIDAMGTLRTLHGRAVEMNDDSGRPSRVAGSLTDVTEQQRTEDALKASEERFRTLVANIPGAVYRSSADRPRTMQYLSDGIESITGYPARNFVGNSVRSFAGIIHPEDRDGVLESARRAGEAGRDFTLDYRLIHRDGHVLWVQEKGHGVRSPDGRPLWLDGVILDATERKNAENGLRKTLAFNQMILRHSPVAISVYDGDTGQCIMANEVLGDMLEDRVEHLTARNFRDIASWRESGLVDLAEEALAGLGTRRKDVRLRTSAGKEVAMDCMFARFDVDGKTYLLRVASDISGRLRMEEIMIQTEKMMSVGGLAAGMAHEINNPLGGIIQSAQVVLGRLTADNPANRSAAMEAGCDLGVIHAFLEKREIVDLVSGMRQSASRAAKIVSDMLEFSRQSGSGKLPSSITTILDKAVELCSNDYDLKKKYDFRHIQIVREYEPGLPAVACVPTQIEQVFMNILRNASQALREPGESCQPPRITLRASRDGGWARIEMEDNGPGMDRATRRRIFEPFFTTKQPGAGTGLGLSVSYFIITSNHGGTIEVQSEPGQGTRFIIRLPLAGTDNR